ncbi:MAG: AI-2E family transporter [Pirellulaceae bacterium]
MDSQHRVSASSADAPAARAANDDQRAASRPPASSATTVLAVLAVLAALYVARDLLVPMALAVLLALLLRPLLRRLRHLHIPDLVGAFLLVGGLAALFVTGFLTLAGQAQSWLAEGPATVRQVQAMLPRRSGPIGDWQETTQAVQNLTQTQGSSEPLKVEFDSSETAYTVLGFSGHFVGAAVIVFVLAYFLLALSETLLRQALSSRGKFVEKRNIVELLRNVEGGISRYLLTITAINIGLGVATALVTWLMGIPNPVLWGVMAMLLNYVPHVGAFLCMAVLFLVGSVTHESLVYGGLTAGAFALLTSAESYFITPMVLSKSLQLSPLAVILAILIGGWFWGIPGGLMAAPLLTILKIICDQFTSLQPIAALLAGDATVNIATQTAEPANSAPASSTASTAAKQPA